MVLTENRKKEIIKLLDSVPEENWNEIEKVIRNAQTEQLCECGGNERIALDCTMKSCKHPKYYKK